ncbi:NUDIX domain-containing protein [Streptococcus rifensis]
MPTQRNMTSLYLIHGDEILLLYREGSRVANHLWVASAGGHLEQGELNNAKQGVLRELKEELGLSESDLRDLQLRYVTLRQTKGEIRVIYFFFAELVEKMSLKSNEGQLKWFSLSDLHNLDMPLTAKLVLEHYIKTGHFDQNLYGGLTVGEVFVVEALV